MCEFRDAGSGIVQILTGARDQLAKGHDAIESHCKMFLLAKSIILE